MSDQVGILFQPIRIGQLEIPGRVIKTATSETRATADGHSTAEQIAFYEPMAMAGTPLIITGNIFVSRDGQSTPNQMGADHDAKIAALAELTAAVHRHGGKIFAQLSHCGRQVCRASWDCRRRCRPRVRDLSIGTLPRPLTVPEIERVVATFADAAQRCQAAGFDGVQIHAGHGHLISQFLTPYTNRRTDAYGGSVEGRTKLLRDVYRTMRARLGPDFPIIIKINGSDWLPLRAGLKTPELVQVRRSWSARAWTPSRFRSGRTVGFPVVRGTFWRCLQGMANGSVRFLPGLWRIFFSLTWPLLALVCNLIWRPSEGYNLRYARQFKAALSIPVICVGGFLTREKMAKAIEDGHCDAVSCGRAFIADPFLYRHLRTARPGRAASSATPAWAGSVVRRSTASIRGSGREGCDAGSGTVPVSVGLINRVETIGPPNMSRNVNQFVHAA